jgi:hypothetical protein
VVVVIEVGVVVAVVVVVVIVVVCCFDTILQGNLFMTQIQRYPNSTAENRSEMQLSDRKTKKKK